MSSLDKQIELIHGRFKDDPDYQYARKYRDIKTMHCFLSGEGYRADSEATTKQLDYKNGTLSKMKAIKAMSEFSLSELYDKHESGLISDAEFDSAMSIKADKRCWWVSCFESVSLGK